MAILRFKSGYQVSVERSDTFDLVLLHCVLWLVGKTRATSQPLKSESNGALLTWLCFEFWLVHGAVCLFWLVRVITFNSGFCFTTHDQLKIVLGLISIFFQSYFVVPSSQIMLVK